MSAAKPQFAIGDTVWCITPYGAVTSGPVTEVSGSVYYIAHGSLEIIAHPAFATQAEAIRYRIREVETELATLRAKLEILEGGAE